MELSNTGLDSLDISELALDTFCVTTPSSDNDSRCSTLPTVFSDTPEFQSTILTAATSSPEAPIPDSSTRTIPELPTNFMSISMSITPLPVLMCSKIDCQARFTQRRQLE